MPASASATPTVSGCSPLRPEDVPALSDDTILALLEEHARRVVEGPDAKFVAPGKVSVMPLVKRKMEYRAGKGELLPDLAGEAAWLEAWIKESAPSHHTPTAGAIENSLRAVYRGLAPRSKAMIQ